MHLQRRERDFGLVRTTTNDVNQRIQLRAGATTVTGRVYPQTDNQRTGSKSNQVTQELVETGWASRPWWRSRREGTEKGRNKRQMDRWTGRWMDRPFMKAYAISRLLRSKHTRTTQLLKQTVYWGAQNNQKNCSVTIKLQFWKVL